MVFPRKFNGKWVKEAGDPRRFTTLVLMDSQGRGPCENPRDYTPMPDALILSISGGTVADIIALMAHPIAARAEFIIVGGLGTNDLGRRATPIPAPPRVEYVSGPKGKRRLHFSEGPTTNNQAPRNKYSDVVEDLQEVYRRKRNGQKIVTMSPFARRSPGHINFQISLLESRIPQFGPDHHHVNTLKYYTARNQGKKRVYGGRRPTKDSLFENDDVHLIPYEVDGFLYCVKEVMSRLGTRTLTPGRRFISNREFRVKF